MAEGQNELIAFNRGLISPLALARADVKRVSLSAQIMTNWMFRVLGSMMLRPGTIFIGTTASNQKAIFIPFIFNNADTALLEITSGAMRILVDEQLVTNPSVATAIANGNPFVVGLTSWTSGDQSGATSSYNSGDLSLVGTGQNYAARYQAVTVASGDYGKLHSIRIVIAEGFVHLRVGTAHGDDSYVNDTVLRQGNYSFTFTPVGNFYIEFRSFTIYISLVQSVAVEAAGIKSIPTPFGIDDLPNIRWEQSADVIFIACDGFQQQRISRFTADSTAWGIDTYMPPDGPFRLANTTATTLTPSAISGNITITSSQPVFMVTQVGGLINITSDGQYISDVVGGASQFSDAIEITGVGSAQRTFGITITGTFVGTLTLQQSVGAPGNWVDIEGWVGNQAPVSTSYNDALDNQIIFYQLGFKGSDYTSGSATVVLTNSGGSITGIARISSFSSSTSVGAQVLTNFGNTSASNNWAEGAWSDYRGWPTALAFLEGRLWFAGRGALQSSVSGAYESFDTGIVNTTIGDSGSIQSDIGSGPVDIINWLLPLFRLVIGGQATEFSVHSSIIDQPLTPTNFIIRAETKQGSVSVPPLAMDVDGFFVNRTGTRLYFITLQNVYYSYNYSAEDKTLYVPEVLQVGVVRIAIQRVPDTRIHCVRTDGAVAILVFDPLEKVEGWMVYTTDGIVEDVIVMPNAVNTPEDKVYYVVNRTINGSTSRTLERWALETECVGGTLNKNIDCHTIYSGSPTTNLSAPQLPNSTIVCWGDGKVCGGVDSDGNPATFETDGSGNFTVPVAVSNAVYGLPYTAPFQSSKLSGGIANAVGLTEKKRIDHLGLVMQNTHFQGLKYGSDFDSLDPLPAVEEGAAVAPDTVYATYDHDAFEFNDYWHADSRICLQAQSPMPCTILGAIPKGEENEKR